MSNLAIFGVIVAAYMILVYAMYREILPTIWGLLLMSVLIPAIVGVMRPGVVSINDFYIIFKEGATRMAPVCILMIFAGVFARSQIDTGIVENIVKRAAELGGDRPLVVTIFLGLATSYVSIGGFVGATFVAFIIALPILMGLGLSPATAAGVEFFGGNIAVLFWVQHWAYLTSLTKVTMTQATPFLLTYLPFVFLTWIAFVIYEFKVNKLPLRWAVRNENLTKVTKKVPLYALLCPLLPILFLMVFKMPDILAFILSIVITVFVTQPGSGRKRSELPSFFTKVFLDGFNEMNYLVSVLIAIGFMLRATDFPYVKEILGGSLQTILPTSAIGFIAFFSFFMAIGGLFRGPACPWGLGGAIFASIASLGKYPALLVGALVGIFNIFTIIGDPSVGGVLYVCTLCRVSIIDYFRKVYKWALIFGVIGIVLITIYFRMW